MMEAHEATPPVSIDSIDVIALLIGPSPGPRAISDYTL